ncbi:MAG: hypothetical protein DRP90_01260 [Planctomycetota bacterium]|nr:MAG: hypothetical protein DRP90_01260 [Planctomycetota bacterium]
MKRAAILIALVLFAFQASAWGEAAGKKRAELDTAKKAEAAAEAKQPQEAGKVTKLEGTAEIFRGEDKFPAAVGFVVREGDRIEVAAKSYMEITLFNVPGKPADGEKNPTVLTLSENAKLTIKARRVEPSGDITTQLELKEGKLGSNVKDGRKAGWKERRDRARARARGRSYRVTRSNYQVKTPTAIAGVRGTEFIVAVTPTKTFVYVKSGRVWVKDLVKGEIRTVGRKRLLEIGMNGFGTMFKADAPVEESMGSHSFSPDFNPARYAAKPSMEMPGAEPEVGEETVGKDVEDKMDQTRATQDSSDVPDPTSNVEPAIAPEPGGETGGGGGGEPGPPEPETLPDPPPPPPPPQG